MNASLSRRVDRLDGGNPHNVKRMGDAQLLRVVARGTPDPAAFLAMSEEQQDEVIDELLRSDKIWPS
jgi:hypothetical protein